MRKQRKPEENRGKHRKTVENIEKTGENTGKPRKTWENRQ